MGRRGKSGTTTRDAAVLKVKNATTKEEQNLLRRTPSEAARDPSPEEMAVDDSTSEGEVAPGIPPEAPPFDEEARPGSPIEPPNKIARSTQEFIIGSDDGGGSSQCTPVAAPAPAPAAASAPVDTSNAAIMAMLASMNQNNSANMDRLTQRFEAQDAKIVHLDRTILSSVGALDDRLEKFKSDVDARFAALSLGASGSGRPPWTKVAPAASAGPDAPPSAAPAVPRPNSATQGQTSTSAEFGLKVFALGFPRKLPASALRAWWETEKARMPAHIVADAIFQGGHGSTFGLKFPTRDAAKMFTASFSTNAPALDFQWASPRAGEGSSKITFRPERSVADRDRGRALSKAWTLISPIVRLCPNWVEGMRLVTDPSRGTISIATKVDMWPLIALKPSPEGHSIIAFDPDLLYFGVGPATVEAIRSNTAATSTSASSAAAASDAI
jgi:hypothetical protein